MKWFKHISDSLDDPFIFDLMDRFGPMGYLVFFGIMEIYAREYKPENGWKLRATLSYLRAKLRATRYQLIVNPLLYIAERGKWEVDIQGDEVTIYIPKFREFMDEHTRKTSGKKTAKNSGVTPESLRCKEEELEVEAEEDIKSTSPIGDVCPEPKKSAPDPRPKKTPPSHEEYMTSARTEAADYIKANRDYLVAAYPCLSGPGGLEEETARAMAWLDANPNKRKKSIPRFLTNWFSRTQERGGHQRAANTGGGYVTVEERNRRAAEEARKLIFDGKPKKGGDGQ